MSDSASNASLAGVCHKPAACIHQCGNKHSTGKAQLHLQLLFSSSQDSSASDGPCPQLASLFTITRAHQQLTVPFFTQLPGKLASLVGPESSLQLHGSRSPALEALAGLAQAPDGMPQRQHALVPAAASYCPLLAQMLASQDQKTSGYPCCVSLLAQEHATMRLYLQIP